MSILIDLKLREDEIDKLAGILGCGKEQLEDKITSYGEAAIQEYIRMFLGQKVFSRGTDIQEYRLYLLIVHAFGNKLPDEQKVCDLFQTTSTKSRSLIRSVMSKYQYDLSSAIDMTLKETILSARQPSIGEDYEFTINSESIVDAMNRSLATMDGTLSQVTKKKSTVSTYVLKPASFEKLKGKYEVDSGDGVL